MWNRGLSRQAKVRREHVVLQCYAQPNAQGLAVSNRSQPEIKQWK